MTLSCAPPPSRYLSFMLNAVETATAVAEAVAAGAASGLLDQVRERVRALISREPRHIQDQYADEAADHALLLREGALSREDVATYWKVRLTQYNIAVDNSVDNSVSTVTFGTVHAQTNYNVGRDFTGTVNI